VTKNRQMLLAILAVVALLAIYEDPAGAGGSVRHALDTLFGVVETLFDFASAVMR
jgi:hypothetical protein